MSYTRQHQNLLQLVPKRHLILVCLRRQQPLQSLHQSVVQEQCVGRLQLAQRHQFPTLVQVSPGTRFLARSCPLLPV